MWALDINLTALTWYRKKTSVTVKSSWRSYFGFVVLGKANRLARTQERVSNKCYIWLLGVNKFKDIWFHRLNRFFNLMQVMLANEKKTCSKAECPYRCPDFTSL